MAIIEVLLLDALRDVGVYAIARSVTGESTMQLRKRVADGKPLVVWDTNDFPSDSERAEHHDQIRVSVSSKKRGKNKVFAPRSLAKGEDEMK